MKTHTKQSNSSSPAAIATPIAAPASTAPKPPEGTVAHPAPRSGYRPQRAQLGCAKAFSEELASAVNPTADLGPHIPNLAVLAAMIGVSSSWSSERVRAEDWRGFARNQEAASWALVGPQLEVLRAAFAFACKRDATIADRFPMTARFFGVRSATVKKGHNHRTPKAAAEATPSAPPTSTEGGSSAG